MADIRPERHVIQLQSPAGGSMIGAADGQKNVRIAHSNVMSALIVTTAHIPSLGSETIEFVPDLTAPYLVAALQNFTFFAAWPGGAFSTHSLSVMYGGETIIQYISQTGGSLDIRGCMQTGVTTPSLPADRLQQLMLWRNLLCDGSTAGRLSFRYNNNAEVPQTGARRYHLIASMPQ